MKSRPMRARGLKLIRSAYILAIFTSRPMRARGLKRPSGLVSSAVVSVAPHAGAWIETTYMLVIHLAIAILIHWCFPEG